MDAFSRPICGNVSLAFGEIGNSLLISQACLCIDLICEIEIRAGIARVRSVCKPHTSFL